MGVSRDKLALTLFFSVVFVSLLMGVYFDRQRKNDAEVIMEPPDGRDIYVDISGAVRSPGVYRIPSDSRVVDLLKVSKGVLDSASTEWVSKSLNLSSKLSDSQKIYVPFDWETSPNYSYEVVSLEMPLEILEESEEMGSEGTNVNSATQKELEDLPGVGEVTSKRIISNRPYVDIKDLEERASLTKSVVEKIRALIVF